MPDGSWQIPYSPPPPTWPGWSGANVLPPPLPPQSLGPEPWQPIGIVDAWGVCLADAQGNIVGTPGDLGRGGPLANLQTAIRSGTRNL